MRWGGNIMPPTGPVAQVPHRGRCHDKAAAGNFAVFDSRRGGSSMKRSLPMIAYFRRKK